MSGREGIRLTIDTNDGNPKRIIIDKYELFKFLRDELNIAKQ